MIVVNVNGGVCGMFNEMNEVVEFFKKECGDVLMFDNGEMSVEEGVKMMIDGMECKVYNKELCEMGDDYCEVEVVEM